MDHHRSYYYQNPLYSTQYGYTYSYPSGSTRSTIMSGAGNILDHVPTESLTELLEDANMRLENAKTEVGGYEETIREGGPGKSATVKLLKRARETQKVAQRDYDYYSALNRLKEAEEKKIVNPNEMKFLRESVEGNEKNMPEDLKLLPQKPHGEAKGKNGKGEKDKKD